MAVEGLRVYFLGYFFAGFNIVTIAYYSAVLKTREAMTLSILRSIVLLIPMVFLLQYLLQMKGVWLSFVITELIVFILMLAIFLKAKNKEKEGREEIGV